MTLTIGSTLEKRYRIEKKLGQGGFGATYLAVDSRLNAHCAVKESLQAVAESQKQFKREWS
jgi:serine/threonine-protein kinase